MCDFATERDIGNKTCGKLIREGSFLEISGTNREWPDVITGFAEYGRPNFIRNRRRVAPRTIVGRVQAAHYNRGMKTVAPGITVVITSE